MSAGVQDEDVDQRKRSGRDPSRVRQLESESVLEVLSRHRADDTYPWARDQTASVEEEGGSAESERGGNSV